MIIFNSHLNQEESILKTPLYDKNNEIKINNNNSTKKEITNHNFIETLKTKTVSITKLTFDSAECHTIQETNNYIITKR